MKFLVVTNAPTLNKEGKLCAYAPYVREMNIWTKYATVFKIVSPNHYPQELLTLPFENQPQLESIPSLQFNSVKHIVLSLYKIPKIIVKLFKAMKWADHIHLRCPGNIGMLGCLVQIFFPNKTKTAKYAGNWDPNAVQPKSYMFQKWVLSNPFLTRNMSVLVYGNWENQTKNIKPFFTASYLDNEKVTFNAKDYSGELSFVFVGSLVEGKRPLFAVQLIEALQKKGIHCKLDVFGDGVLKEELQNYIVKNSITNVQLHGNQTKETIKDYLLKSHFSILASKSEGWPKALAEAMFFGVIPIATKISCVPYMLDYGKRGILIEAKLISDVNTIEMALKNKKDLIDTAKNAQLWSQQFTLDIFEKEIKTLLH